MKKNLIFVALLSTVFFVSCKNSEVKPEETTELTDSTMTEQVDGVATDSTSIDEVAPVGEEKDTLTTK